MNRLFGTKKEKGPPPELGECISKLDERAEGLEKKIDKLSVDLKKLSEQLAKTPNGPAKNLMKQRAVSLLRQRKQYEQQLESIQKQSFNIDQQRFALQSVKDTQITLDAMKFGVKEMKKEMKKVNVDYIENLQDELEDYLFQADEMQEILSRNYTMPDINEEDLEAELEAIANEIVSEPESTSNYLDEFKAPTVPSREPGIATSSVLTNKEGIQIDEYGLPVVPSKL